MRVIDRASGLVGVHGGVVVPTMGALHAGHVRLIERARGAAEDLGARSPVVVTIFVNPTQFNDPGDLVRYPRTPEADLEACAAAGADAVFLPGAAEVYPPGATVRVPELPAVATQPGLEDAHRPGHFAGVCQVVLRLFELCRPRAAIFGEKDWQQLRVVEAMTRRERPEVRIVSAATVREPDGLAMSSRNRLLEPRWRAAARAIPEALAEAAAAPNPDLAQDRLRERLEAAGLAVEYAVVRDGATLRPVADPAAWRAPGRGPLRALVAARAGDVRLIDNAPWPGPAGQPGHTG
ncbi:MAG TPA: pantoate--beta-alanine ligase [Phycisphaerales bacterium]|nr:pantoate--beta-alanine ligase [Phycisphaerales bacterium]